MGAKTVLNHFYFAILVVQGEYKQVFKVYLNEHQLKGGFVRFDQESSELLIATDSFNDDSHFESWGWKKLLRNNQKCPE